MRLCAYNMANPIIRKGFVSMASKYSYREVMNMNEKEFGAIATTNAANKAWMKEAIKRVEIRKSYPRIAVFSEEKGKIVYVADKTKKATTKQVPISFMSLKKAFCTEVLKLEFSTPKKQETFRERYEAQINQ